MTEPKPSGGVKKLTKNPLFLVGGAVALGIVFYEYRKQKNAAAVSAASAAAAGSSTTATDYSGTDPNSVYDSGYSAAVDGGAIGSPYGALSSGSVNIATTPSSNAAWAQQAETTLIALQYDPATTAAAIGKYLLGNGLTPDQLQIVQAAIGQIGYPPQGVPAPTLATAPGQSATGGTTTQATTGTVPAATVTHVPNLEQWARANSPLVSQLYQTYLQSPTAQNQGNYADAVDTFAAQNNVVSP